MSVESEEPPSTPVMNDTHFKIKRISVIGLTNTTILKRIEFELVIWTDTKILYQIETEFLVINLFTFQNEYSYSPRNFGLSNFQFKAHKKLIVANYCGQK